MYKIRKPKYSMMEVGLTGNRNDESHTGISICLTCLAWMRKYFLPKTPVLRVKLTGMANIKSITNIWKNIREMDLRPLREQATRDLNIIAVGRAESAKRTLGAQMCTDPSRPDMVAERQPIMVDIEERSQPSELTGQIGNPDLILMMVDANGLESTLERRLAKYWSDMGLNVLVVVNTQVEEDPDQGVDVQEHIQRAWQGWEPGRLIVGSVGTVEFSSETLVPAVLALLPERYLSLGRNYPLFRIPLARRVINEACTANAAYSLGTGIAETMPALGIPLNVADMVVLTKAQAFLVYKLGLLLGLSTSWQDYVTEFGGVLGSGFFWRQVARQLVGLIPAWGIIPKVSVAYAGTYVVGNVVLHWYLTGRHVSRAQIRQLYREAYTRGKNLARDLIRRAPRPKLRGRQPKELPSPQVDKTCPSCGRLSDVDANYCQYCGHEFGTTELQN